MQKEEEKGMKTALVIFIAIASIVFSDRAAYTQPGDAENGAILFSQKCSRCHGGAGQGGIGPSLVGCDDCGSTDSLFDTINDDMPFDNPGDCIDTCAWDTAAFIFKVLNGPSTSTTPSGQGPCAAEAIYGEHSEKTTLLRYFRDEILTQSPGGQELIRLYYELSPVIVKAMEEDEAFKEDVKKVIDDALIMVSEEE